MTKTATAPQAPPKSKSDPRVKAAQELLNAHGFPCGKADGLAGPKTAAAVKRFQTAYAGGRKGQADLAVDGQLGVATRAALGQLPYLSKHFTAGELRSKGDGTCYVHRELVKALERLRDAVGEPIQVRSGYRDPAHNKRVDGAKDSMHVQGLAADVWCRTRGKLRIERVMALRLFSGLGDADGIVLHVDLRHLAGQKNRTPGATPERPARWHY